MLIATLLLFGSVLVLMTLAEHPVRRLPLSPALIYLIVGWAAALLGQRLLPPLAAMSDHASTPWELWMRLTEWTVLLSLFSIGLKLRVPRTWRAWRPAVLLASIGMIVMVGLTAAAAVALLGLSWVGALLLGGILAPTDPVLASDVQVRDGADRDAVRMTLTVEGALNDGTAFPVVMAALGLMGLHEVGVAWLGWFVFDLLWAVGGGVLVGWMCGWVIGSGLRAQQERYGRLSFDELLFLGVIAVAAGVSSLMQVSAFMTAFAAGAVLLHRAVRDQDDLELRLVAFGERCERLAEVTMVVLIGAALSTVEWRAETLLFSLGLALVIRPLTVLFVLPRMALPRQQHLLVAWFGIRGVGSVFYLAFALHHGVTGALASTLISTTLISVAVSIVLHGVSATPLMRLYRWRGERPR